ncbi:ergothioneine biosynthesis protein EgtC [Solwaraspora sp. WMMD791]|uniref:ergothioneine biosynthesis protein EgtC n=1 Tax=Solwaraspora sp. WMMD791 TaxID=3016086 RepID=UPI00249B027B|nr:ergothioneine biosynthesis protein EgtC [Solwaraspora sp. WMMD791]WFE29902.1 ergothioneine biosynthesis protein EgtC [Solwaraspora sp. WMMD791]
MCRHQLYLGPPASLATLLIDPAHSLYRQSWAPRQMRGGGTVNADGFGIGWYAGTGSDAGIRANPVRYRRAVPIWADQSLPELARATVTGALLAAVRSATPGMPVVETACAPFTEGRWLFSHNGVVAGWPASVADLAATLPVTDLLTLDAPTDAALLWALVRHRLRAGTPPAAAIADTVTGVLAVAPASRLNLLLTDGAQGWASTVGHTLAVRADPDRIVVASEPTDDDPGWTAVPDRRLVVATPTTYTVEELCGSTSH